MRACKHILARRQTHVLAPNHTNTQTHARAFGRAHRTHSYIDGSKLAASKVNQRKRKLKVNYYFTWPLFVIITMFTTASHAHTIPQNIKKKQRMDLVCIVGAHSSWHVIFKNCCESIVLMVQGSAGPEQWLIVWLPWCPGQIRDQCCSLAMNACREMIRSLVNELGTGCSIAVYGLWPVC